MDIETIKKHIDDVLTETNFANLGEKKVGKVRDVYVGKDTITLVSTDRHTSFDRRIADVPFKGEVLTQISLFWFDQTKDIIQNHIISNPDPSAVIVKKCKVIPIEMVVRGYITGSTNTSIWPMYEKGERTFYGITLPIGMKKNQKLTEPVLTPTTKSDEHDRPITPAEIVAEGTVPEALWNEMAEKAIAVFKRGQEIALSKGLILVDTKYEFGLDDKGNLTLIDEVHTPDSSRYWKADTYEERFSQGLDPEFFDKEFLRLWFKDNCDPYNDKVLPKAPPELVAELSRRYIEIYETITGKKFNHDFSHSTLERITNNLAKI
jgi:phosphoribosylaminoimidazole-succinocarboxamide synthase